MAWTDNKNYKGRNGFDEMNRNRSSAVVNSDYLKGNKIKKPTKSDEFWANAKKWIWYYRSNIHRLPADAGVRLKDFQKILMYMMDKYPMFLWIASRGTGKSFLIMLYCICRAILYPGSQIVVSSGTKGQSILMLQQYAKMFYNDYPFFRNEIKEISTNKAEPKVEFYNGSTIFAVTASDNSRGYRSNLLILEEFRMIKKEVLDSVLRKFGTTPRQPPYLSKPEYKHMIENNKEIYISSAWYQSHWAFEKMKSFWDKMRQEGNDYTAVMSTDIDLPMYEGLYDEKKLNEEKAELDNDPITWSMEMDSLWFGEGKSEIFKYSDFEKNRVIKKCKYPYRNEDFIGVRNKPKPKKKAEGVISLLSVDIALSSKKNSDNAVIKYWELKEIADGYKREVLFIKTLNGSMTDDLVLAVKRLWYDYDVDYIAYDIQTIGLPVYDSFTKTTEDPMRDIEFPAMKAYNEESGYTNRAYEKNAISNMLVLSGSLSLNDRMYKDLSANLKDGKIKFLIGENEFRDNKIQQNDKYMLLSAEERVEQELPYVQTNLMVTETISLDVETSSGKIKVKEVGSSTKDRFSALVYGNWLASVLEYKMLKGRQVNNDDDCWVDEY